MKHYKTIKAWEIRKYHWKPCKLETNKWNILEWKISVNNDWRVYIVHNNKKIDWYKPDNMFGYTSWWLIYYSRECEDNNHSDNTTYKWIEINLDEFTYWEEVEVSDWLSWYKSIFISEIPWNALYKYTCVHGFCEEKFINWEEFNTENWKKIRKLHSNTPEYTMEELTEKIWHTFKIKK